MPFTPLITSCCSRCTCAWRSPSGSGPRQSIATPRARAPCSAPACTDFQNSCCVPLRSEEHTSELQSLRHLVCRLLLEKKKMKDPNNHVLPENWDETCRVAAQLHHVDLLDTGALLRCLRPYHPEPRLGPAQHPDMTSSA